MIWIALALMTAGAVLSIVWPLLRPRTPPSTVLADVRFYKDQIAELDETVGRGMLPASDVAASRAELGRRLLAAAERSESVRPLGRGHLVVAAVSFVLVPVLALGLYVRIGRPVYADDPLAMRGTPSQDIAAMVQRVEAHLAGSPDDARGYELLAPTYMQMGRYADAARAWGEVIRIEGTTPEREASYGQALVVAADGVVTQVARDLFERAAKADKPPLQARFFLGLAAEQDGDKTRARELWTKLVAEAPPGAPWADLVRRHLAALDGTPVPRVASSMPSGPAAAGIAALPPDQRDAAIRGMVDGLAARLQQNGGDPDGWLRLVRAYKVLGETGKAERALTEARRSLGSDAEALSRLDDLAREMGSGG